MIGKRIPFGERPHVVTAAGDWLRGGESSTVGAERRAAGIHCARLTIDVTPDLRGRIKVEAFRRGETVASVLRELLEREFPMASEEAPR